MSRVVGVMIVLLCGCGPAPKQEWIVSADACGISTVAALSMRVDAAANTEIVARTPGETKLVIFGPDGKLATKIPLPVDAHGAARIVEGTVVVGDGTPPDGGARAPYVALIDAAGAAKWVTRLSTSGTSSRLAVAAHDGVVAVTVSVTGGSVLVNGVAITDGLLVLASDGAVRGAARIDRGDGPARIAFDVSGIVVGTTTFTSFALAAFDRSARPRWRQFVESGTLHSLAGCLDGVLASATTDGPRLLRFDAAGNRTATTDTPNAGAIAACDTRGYVVAGTMAGVLMDPRFRPIGVAGEPGAYIATFALDGNPGELRSFGGKHSSPTRIATFNDRVHLAGTFTWPSCEAPQSDVFVARVKR